MSNNNQPSILVTGATGMIGSHLVDALVERNVVFSAMVRANDKTSKVEGKRGVTLVNGDFDDPASLAQALNGVERAFLVTNSSQKTEEQQKRFVEVAAQAGVRHLVKLSQFAAQDDSPVRFLRYHAAVETAIRASGIGFTFIRPNLILQAYLAFAAQIGRGVLQAPIQNGRVSVVDVRDIAAVAATVLLDESHFGKTYDVTGPKAVTHEEVARSFANAIHRPVRFESVPPAAFSEALQSMGMTAWQADGLVEDYQHYQRGEAAVVSKDVAQVTGQTPYSVDDFAMKYAADLGGETPALV